VAYNQLLLIAPSGLGRLLRSRPKARRYVFIGVGAMSKNIFIIFIMLVSMSSMAKRAVPQQVAPVEYEGVIYKIVPWANDNGTSQNGGFIQAIDKSTNKVLWQLQIYKTKYMSSIERDVQDVFITSIKIDSEHKILLIQNEKGLMYKVSIKDRRVIGVKLNT